MSCQRVFLSLTLLCVVTAAGLGQDQPPAKRATDVVDPRQPPDKEQKKTPDKSAEVVARVAKDMKSAAERLEKTDPGDGTRKIQDEIVAGLDELIKQNTKSQGGGGGSKSSKKKQDSGQPKNSDVAKAQPKEQQGDPQQGKQADDQDQPGKAKGSGGDKGPQGQEKEKGKGEGKDDQEGMAKKAGKDDKMGQAKADDPPKDGEKGGGGGKASAKDDRGKVKTNLTAELHRNDWGHLPMTKRLEMDAYSRERFMPRYDEALQQYYRAIAEQAQRKD